MREKRLKELEARKQKKLADIETSEGSIEFKLNPERARPLSTQETHYSSSDRQLLQDLDDRRRESYQGHVFRYTAFTFGVVAWIGCSIIWCVLLLNWPEGPCAQPSRELYYLWAFKTSLTTIVLLTLSVSLMRFAMRCYGHHHGQERMKTNSDNAAEDAVATSVLKEILKDALKTWSSH